MSVIKVVREHHLSEEEVKKIAEDVVVSLAEEFGVKYHWEDDTVRFKGAGAKGRMTLLPGALDLTMELGFLLIPLKGKIEKSIARRLDECLNS
jgi:putative polyhydroxyalkanoate system protein